MHRCRFSKWNATVGRIKRWDTTAYTPYSNTPYTATSYSADSAASYTTAPSTTAKR